MKVKNKGMEIEGAVVTKCHMCIQGKMEGVMGKEGDGKLKLMYIYWKFSQFCVTYRSLLTKDTFNHFPPGGVCIRAMVRLSCFLGHGWSSHAHHGADTIPGSRSRGAMNTAQERGLLNRETTQRHWVKLHFI